MKGKEADSVPGFPWARAPQYRRERGRA